MTTPHESPPSTAGGYAAHTDDPATVEGDTRRPVLDALGSVSGELQALSSKARGLPSVLEREVKDSPLAALGVAAGVGFGLGMIFSSRLTRMLLLSVGGYALNEVLKARVKKYLDATMA
ncbi:MAG: hypothetical protein U0324_21210 [Polyangiales bacterium]